MPYYQKEEKKRQTITIEVIDQMMLATCHAYVASNDHDQHYVMYRNNISLQYVVGFIKEM